MVLGSSPSGPTNRIKALRVIHGSQRPVRGTHGALEKSKSQQIVINMSKPTPEILYKYRNFDARSISMLRNNQIYFASPLDFNDPFDCVAHEHMLETLNPQSLELLARLHPQVSPENITHTNTEHLIEAIQQRPEFQEIIAEQKNALNKFLNETGVLCLSSCNDSILMWSHYANYHKGFCIGFKNKIGMQESLIIGEVAYTKARSNDLIPLSLFSQLVTEEEAINNLLKVFFFTKYIDWQYEQEWRVMGKRGIEIYPDHCIDRIIFGLNMPLEERNTIRCILKNQHIKFFEAVKSKEYFSIEIKPLNITIVNFESILT